MYPIRRLVQEPHRRPVGSVKVMSDGLINAMVDKTYRHVEVVAANLLAAAGIWKETPLCAHPPRLS